MSIPLVHTPAKTRLLASAVKLVRESGYDATTVDELCLEAGVTKGAFFYHFQSKEALAVAATKFWMENAN
ncbi:MAG: TetR/AcrR family transcriptional regulator, partial [Pseudomonadota bacterium]|nr:TetR/AcrR family transcriptional regulator [Pseudomonadota bacterium]